MRAIGWRIDRPMAPATSVVLTRKYSGATIAADRTSAETLPSASSVNASGRPATAVVSVSDAMLKTTRCGGFLLPARSVHCDHAPAVAMPTVGQGPSAKSAQKFTACDSDRFDWLRPSGNSIFAADAA